MQVQIGELIEFDNNEQIYKVCSPSDKKAIEIQSGDHFFSVRPLSKLELKIHAIQTNSYYIFLKVKNKVSDIWLSIFD